MQQNCWKLGPERLKNKAFASFHLFLFIIFCKCQYVCLTVSSVPPSHSGFSISFPYYSTKRQKSTITYRQILTIRNPPQKVRFLSNTTQPVFTNYLVILKSIHLHFQQFHPAFQNVNNARHPAVLLYSFQTQ